MGSIPLETFDHLHQQQQEEDGNEMNKRMQRTNWVLSSPDPPGPLKELVGAAKAAFLPRRRKPGKKTPSKGDALFSILKGIFPILSWGRNYKASKFKSDLMAGLTLASLCIPQSIGYANLAKLEPQYGLYTSVIPPLIYAFMGSSRELAIGPVAVVSLLLSSMIQKLEDPTVHPSSYTKLVLTATFFAGAFQAIFGLFRLGFLVDFLSHAAIVGFMGGAALVIGLQQLKNLLGISHFTTNTDVVSVLSAVFEALHHPFSPLNFVIGCSFLIFILITRFIGRRNKKLFWVPAMAPLVSVILSTLIVYVTKADKHGVIIVKHFKGGLNPSSVHQLQLSSPHTAQIAKIGLICAIVALTEAIAVGRSFASIKGYHMDGNKEMVAMGCMNLVGSLTSCYVATGSFSRTAVNFSAGCETVVSNIVMAATVFLSLELFTRLLYYTPMTILASIILSALPGLIDIREAYNIWKVDKLDFVVCLGAFIGVLFGSVEIGLLLAVGISFGKIILGVIRPGTEVLGRIPETDSFCDTKQYPMAIKTPGLLIVRPTSALLCFANSTFIRERIMRWLEEEEVDDDKNISIEDSGKSRTIHALIIDMSNLMSVDTSGIIVLEEIHRKLLSLDIKLVIANPRQEVIHRLKLAKFVDKIGDTSVFLTVNEAVGACFEHKMIV
ncbi:low affinity sulfate transporter 3-like [Impatiens glandulifera]|uniref:low affinity sulfate transporter 3-like n=1 Tax=Impatiens glandulifera TaxID=253017 RepID=UPI001FB09DBD|nr:low affinity sulfate transporter 3-like [Impatiens glandulifera]